MSLHKCKLINLANELRVLQTDIEFLSVCSVGHSPEETLPGWEVGPLEQGVFQDSLHAPQGLDHVRPVVVQIPQLPIMPLMGPPKRVLLQHLKYIRTLHLLQKSPNSSIISTFVNHCVMPGNCSYHFYICKSLCDA